jgi:hypothetical protein
MKKVDEEWGKPNGFLEEMRTIPESEYGKIDFVGGINPAIQAYNGELERPEYVNNIVFRKTRKFSGGFFILKNLQKQQQQRPSSTQPISSALSQANTKSHSLKDV